MSTQIHNREGARRQHRTLALFAVIQCWTRQLDGIVFEKRELQRLLGLEVVKPGRVPWLKEDFQPWFPYIKDVFFSKWYGSLWVNRYDFLGDFPSEPGTKKRIERMPQFKFGIFNLWEDLDAERLKKIEILEPFLQGGGSANFDERLLTSYLTMLAQGQIPVESIPSLKN
jgi:hypothetical protein